MYRTPIQIRFNDVDLMGHVNNAVIMEYFDLGKSNYFAEAGLPPESGDFTVMIVHFEVDFHQQMHSRDEIAVETRTARFGTKSLHIEQQVVRKEADGSWTPCATCHTVMAGYSRKLQQSAPVPEEVKEQIRQFDAKNE